MRISQQVEPAPFSQQSQREHLLDYGIYLMIDIFLVSKFNQMQIYAH